MSSPIFDLDPRGLLARPDLAEQALEGLVRAAAYRPTTAMHGRLGVADVTADRDPGSERIDQLIMGEAFDVLERDDDRVWGRARRSGAVGWLDRWALAGGAPLATHRVSAVDAALPLNALVHHGFSGVNPEDLSPVGDFESDPVGVAERLLGIPHELGARTSRSTDCSGLIQQCLQACGRAAPRWSDQQAELGHAVDAADARRGDLVVWLKPDSGASWTGHSAWVLEPGRLIHASGAHGKVVVEAFVDADARYRADGFQPARVRRP